MNLSDVILNLVDRLIMEKQQNFILQQRIEEQNNQVNEEQKNKDLL